MVARSTEPFDGTADEAPLLTSIEGGVLLARLNRPQAMNALSGHAAELLLDAVAEASESDEVHALVLTGEGRGFCAGADLGDLAAHEGGDAPRYHRMDRRGLSGELAEAFARCDVPIIAAVNGPAVGAGFGLALCCDVRFLGASARMGSVFVKRGLAADYGAAWWLPRIVGHARAIDLYRHNAAFLVVVQDHTLCDFNRPDAGLVLELHSEDVRFRIVDGFRLPHYRVSYPRGMGRPGRSAQTSPSRTNVS